MKILSLTILLTLLVGFSAYAADGVLNVESKFNVRDTADRMEKTLIAKGMTIFNRINHSENADKVGIELRETELIIFGNPKAGSPLIKCQQSIAIDLPQKALIWQDEENKVWISYNDTMFLKNRHNITGCEKVLSKIQKTLASVTKSASIQ